MFHAPFMDQLRQLVGGCGGWSDDREQSRFAFEKTPKNIVGGIVGHFGRKGRLRRRDFNWVGGTLVGL